ncbi:MAG: NAD-glutamate dehydrogenase [Deltaproteobacteria bacterium]|nr:NAD-glutamate dehydrogenase [Candidatus Anaeroferrophillacea bacterium]
MFDEIRDILRERGRQEERNFAWLRENLNPYFFITMADERDALANLVSDLHTLAHSNRLLLADRDDQLIQARLSTPGSLFRSFTRLPEKMISYAEVCHSYQPVPGTESALEIQRFEFRRREPSAIVEVDRVTIPRAIREPVAAAMSCRFPGMTTAEFNRIFRLMWLNNESYIRISPPERVARIICLYHEVVRCDGLFLAVENSEDVIHHQESRLIFGVGNPPEGGFLAQVTEVFNRLNVGIRRSYSLNIHNGINPYFLGTFYVATRDGELVWENSPLFRELRTELYNTQILANSGRIYTEFLGRGILNGEEATLTNALIAFCHSTLAHNRPEVFDLGEVKRAFYHNPEMAQRIARLFFRRFDPEAQGDAAERGYQAAYEQLMDEIGGYNTGHRHLDGIRREIFRTAALLVRHTLKTNFFVPEKHALAFRLDPAYLEALGSAATGDLPAGAAPFRVTFFYGRYGAGYHVGFSDIARGGWRTIICRTADDFAANADTLFREVYVLAHTQHLKNKDIYEGGSKMGVVLDVSDVDDPAQVTQRLYKLQYGFLNAFLDLFVTGADGRAASPYVRDYYGEEEPIELGPDENMHDEMIEFIARQSVKRGYLLGAGLISSKRAGINHKEYGVTSLGVITFAEITMRELGINMHHDPFTVKLTGGPSGDVAGNAIKLLLERCPRAAVKLVVAGTGVAGDPEGLDRGELGRLVLAANIDDFDPARLNPGGFIMSRRERRRDGLVERYRKLVRTAAGVEEQWITADEMNREWDGLIFTVDADLFIPAGGRPETIDESNWERLFGADGKPSCRVIVEGANSFITPGARTAIQQRGVVVIRDAAANKCGVISSSYEIIANLLFSEREFMAHKREYVADVLEILARRARDEANLIFRRHREADGAKLFTEIAADISNEINGHYARLFAYFQAHPEFARSSRFQPVLLAHLPAFIRENLAWRRRIRRLPAKYVFAILAGELASTIVYHGGWEVDLTDSLKRFVNRHFPGETS